MKQRVNSATRRRPRGRARLLEMRGSAKAVVLNFTFAENGQCKRRRQNMLVTRLVMRYTLRARCPSWHSLQLAKMNEGTRDLVTQ